MPGNRDCTDDSGDSGRDFQFLNTPESSQMSGERDNADVASPADDDAMFDRTQFDFSGADRSEADEIRSLDGNSDHTAQGDAADEGKAVLPGVTIGDSGATAIQAAAAVAPNAAAAAESKPDATGTAVSGSGLTKPTMSSAEPLSQAANNPRNAAAGTRSGPLVVGYAVAVTLVLLFLLLTNRIHLSPTHPLESLPDLRPLEPNEFQPVPPETALPDGHAISLGQSQRFGNIVLTPVKVTREPIRFEHFMTGKPQASLTTAPVLKLWFECRNVSRESSFPAYDVQLMSKRSPPDSDDENTEANSYLTIAQSNDKSVDHQDTLRVLNYLHSRNDNFIIVDQHANEVIAAESSVTTFVASSESIDLAAIGDDTRLTWRIQVRKGVHPETHHGVTTLVDVTFLGNQIESSLE